MSNYQILKQSESLYIISGLLNQNTVPDFWQNRNQLLLYKEQLTLDLSDVSSADSAGLALLTCLQAEFKQTGKQLSFINIPNQLKQLIELSQLEDILNVKQSI